MAEQLADINERLQKLRKTFALALPDRLTGIDTLWANVKHEGFHNSDKAPELLRAVHTLAGSAGTFGQSQLGEVARTLEQTLSRVLATDDCMTAKIISDIEAQLLALKNSVCPYGVVEHKEASLAPSVSSTT